jgi:hypothetical protein
MGIYCQVSWRRRWIVAVGAVAAGPSLLWTRGADFLTDDWGSRAEVARYGALTAIRRFLQSSHRRPGSAVYLGIDESVLRSNVVAHALLFAALLRRAAPNVRVLAAMAAVPLVWLAAQNATDLRDYRRAVVDQHIVLARLAADVPEPPPHLVVGPTMPNRGGVAGFVYPGDLAAAMALRRGFNSPVATIATSNERFASSRHPRYDWHQRRLVPGG